MPAMWMRTPPGGLSPRSAGMYCRDAEHQLRRDDALGEDALLAVQVVEEQLQRGQPLHEAALEARPFGGAR